MDAVAFMRGFAEEWEKLAAKKGVVRRAAKKVSKGVRRAGWESVRHAAPYALLAGVPLYFGAKAVSEGFGKGVSEEADKRLPYER